MREEIMVGDWLMYKSDSQENAFPVKVDYNMFCNELHKWEDRFEPIQLTKEILEKNGFTDCESDFEMGVYHYYIGEKNFIADSSLHIGTENHTCYWLNYKKTFAIFDIRYVHELQHAFRICKIDKNIEL